MQAPGLNVTKVTCISCRKSAGSTNRVVHQASVRVGHGLPFGGLVRRHEEVRFIVSRSGLVALADPDEGRAFRGSTGPLRTRWNISEAAFTHLVSSFVRELYGAFEHEQHALHALVRFSISRATRLQLDDVLRKGLREPGQGPREHPAPCFIPAGQRRRDDVP